MLYDEYKKILSEAVENSNKKISFTENIEETKS